ncbi:hypothetical protein E2C01_081936 [Portunus trituberculatus]|uniref:Uncharacterized protein n=1 Tax=Portunus trituberculatus TaxID=210409 RepID=A0A5B7IX66_PORTR|nr:hypothetical protein [Portunus trituberculatus]
MQWSLRAERDRRAPELCTNDLAIYDSIIAVCDQSTIIALLTKIGSCGLSLTVETGPTVNVLLEDLFRAIKRNFRGG